MKILGKKKVAIPIMVISVLIVAFCIFEMVTDSDAYKINSYLKKANAYMDSADYDAALSAYQSVLDIDICNKQAYMGMLKAYAYKGEYGLTEELVETAKIMLTNDFSEADSEVINELIASTHTHDYTDATCTEAAVCRICNAMGEEAIGHDFAEADCLNPRTCSRCGATEGEALGHDFEDATMWSPMICKVCNASEGNPLPSGFEEHGIACITDIENVYEDNLVDHNIPLKISFSDYKCFEGDDKHEAKEGYIWQSVKFNATMYLNGDDWTYRHGVGIEDFYDAKLADDTANEINDDMDQYSVMYKNQMYNECIRGIEDFSMDYYPARDGEYGGARAVTKGELAFRVPKGYDGNVFAFYKTLDNWNNRECVYDYSEEGVYFRLPAAE